MMLRKEDSETDSTANTGMLSAFISLVSSQAVIGFSDIFQHNGLHLPKLPNSTHKTLTVLGTLTVSYPAKMRGEKTGDGMKQFSSSFGIIFPLLKYIRRPAQLPSQFEEQLVCAYAFRHIPKHDRFLDAKPSNESKHSQVQMKEHYAGLDLRLSCMGSNT